MQRQRAQQAKKIKATTLAMAKQNFESKHPVSLLGELSAKKKMGAPLYELVMQEGPSHQRQFLFRVCSQHYLVLLAQIETINHFVLYDIFVFVRLL